MAGVLLLAINVATTRAQTVTPDLNGLPAEKGWKLINRSASIVEKDGPKAVRLEGDDGTGFARLENFTFANGTIELDIRGRNVVQQSFLGVAFHGSSTSVATYDAIYFRPFNFKAADAARSLRAVQYIAHPLYTWQKLRSAHPGKYEKPVSPVPEPEDWFHVRIVIAWPKVSVTVNDAAEPCLVVEQLSDRKTGWIGLWTDVKGGDFANLKITPDTESPVRAE